MTDPKDLLGKKHTVTPAKYRRFPETLPQRYMYINKITGTPEINEAGLKRIKERLEIPL